MSESIKICGGLLRGDDCDTAFLTPAAAERALNFHKTLPNYAPTPLHSLPELALWMGVGGFCVKDESKRFGLNAFKALGCSFAMAKLIGRAADISEDEVTFEKLLSADVRARIGRLTFITATDGNHGRGVAWSARLLGHSAVVYMPGGSSAERAENIRKLGAEVTVTELNYDDTVRLAAAAAAKNGWLLLQDTACGDYTQVPRDIMQGYAAIMLEAERQLPAPPTHIFLQAGVGSFAGAILGAYAEKYGENRPLCVIAEAENAACLFKTAMAADGKLRSVGGELKTIMAGLACGEGSTVAWPILSRFADAFAACGDCVTENGMRALAHCGEHIVSGESGAVTTGLALSLAPGGELSVWREKLKIDGNSHILCISTEGDTDKAGYNRIVGG